MVVNSGPWLVEEVEVDDEVEDGIDDEVDHTVEDGDDAGDETLGLLMVSDETVLDWIEDDCLGVDMIELWGAVVELETNVDAATLVYRFNLEPPPQSWFEFPTQSMAHSFSGADVLL